jgi:hypothetical protein
VVTSWLRSLQCPCWGYILYFTPSLFGVNGLRLSKKPGTTGRAQWLFKSWHREFFKELRSTESGGFARILLTEKSFGSSFGMSPLNDLTMGQAAGVNVLPFPTCRAWAERPKFLHLNDLRGHRLVFLQGRMGLLKPPVLFGPVPFVLVTSIYKTALTWKAPGPDFKPKYC